MKSRYLLADAFADAAKAVGPLLTGINPQAPKILYAGVLQNEKLEILDHSEYRVIWEVEPTSEDMDVFTSVLMYICKLHNKSIGKYNVVHQFTETSYIDIPEN